jgi:hypothetical protein
VEGWIFPSCTKYMGFMVCFESRLGLLNLMIYSSNTLTNSLLQKSKPQIHRTSSPHPPRKHSNAPYYHLQRNSSPIPGIIIPASHENALKHLFSGIAWARLMCHGVFMHLDSLSVRGGWHCMRGMSLSRWVCAG